MDSHFADAASDRSNVSGIAERQPIDPGEDFAFALRSRRFLSQSENSSVLLIVGICSVYATDTDMSKN
jgi:hypothetical protein